MFESKTEYCSSESEQLRTNGYELAELRRDVESFVAAIRRCPREKLRPPLSAFPKGSCHDASLLLARYLFLRGFSDIECVRGIRENQTHAWLEMSDIIIDITACQLDDKHPPVLITVNREWHAAFREEGRCDADFEKVYINDPRALSILRNAFKAIQENLVK